MKIALNPKTLGLEESKKREWLIPNNNGGYSSSSIAGNQSRYHALLVSECGNLQRIAFLESLEERIQLDGESISVSNENLTSFEFDHNSVSFLYTINNLDFVKTLVPVRGKNALLAIYRIKNKGIQQVEFSIDLLVNSRDPSTIVERGAGSFIPKKFTDHILGIKCENGYITAYSEKAFCFEYPEKRWKETGEISACIPAFFSTKIPPDREEEFSLLVIAYETEELVARAFKELQHGHQRRERLLAGEKGLPILSLLNVANSFIVDRDSKKTIIAGYPSLGELGREAMISLPGLTMINSRFKDSELILERWLNLSTLRGIPSRFENNTPVYRDIDTPLWLIDRLYRYIKYIGEEKGKRFLHTYWWALKDIIRNYAKKEKDGLLIHKGGTWMTSIERDNAVEIQGLWYNALRIMEKFSELMEDTGDINFEAIYKRHEENFLEAYWNESYLSDTLSDNSLRPNQIIPLSLEFHVIDNEVAKKIILAVEKLLTGFGLRTLAPESPSYQGEFREGVKVHNGMVFPWLLGSYITAYMKLFNRRIHMQNLLEPLFEKHLLEAGIGTISEFMDSNPPNRPRGCISYSCSVAEILRAYFEDIMGKKSLQENRPLS